MRRAKGKSWGLLNRSQREPPAAYSIMINSSSAVSVAPYKLRSSRITGVRD